MDEKSLQKAREWYAKNKERVSAERRIKYQNDSAYKSTQLKNNAKSRSKNKKKILEKAKEYRLKNKSRISEKQKEYRNKRYDYLSNYYKNYRHKNKEKIALSLYHGCRKRQASKISAIPKWADMEKIKDFYKSAKEKTKQLGIKYVVDHIVPLQGKTVCGLHCHRNLQVITELANRRKYNHHC